MTRTSGLDTLAALERGYKLWNIAQLAVLGVGGVAVRALTLAKCASNLPRIGRMAGRMVPLGMKSLKQLDNAFADIRNATRAGDVIVGLRGSAVTGVSATRGVSRDLEIVTLSL